MTRRTAVLALAVLVSAWFGGPEANPGAQVRFRGAVDVVRVDVVVRDRQGRVVTGLTVADFEITEDGKPQVVTTFDFEQILDAAPPSGSPAPAVLDRPAAPASATSAAAREVVDLPGRRLIVLFFDLSSMEPEDLDRAAGSARRYIDDEMSPADLVAIASLSQSLDVNQDFTADKDLLRQVLDRFTGVDASPEILAADETDPAADPADLPLDDSELSLFNNDRRLRALQVLADALAPVQQKKSIVYFSSGMARSGSDNQIELRATVNAAVRANAAIYAIDTRGLQAVVPGGAASQASARGTSAFSGRGAARQFDRMFASQETLTTLAKDTGGEAFFDTNDFGEAFDQVRQDTSAYYVLGYSSTNAVRDGRFRKIGVRVKTPGLRIEHRAGYYAAKDFTHFTRDDRERQLQEQLFSEVSSTDLPVVASASWFRIDASRFYVPVSVAIPGGALPADRPARSTLDVMGSVRDEQGRYIGRIRDTVQLPGVEDLAQKQMQYQTGFTLPPGRFWVKIVARENVKGTIGTFEAPIIVPDLASAPMKVSSVVLGTQIRRGPPRARTDNPLIRDGVELIPSLTHVVGRDQRLYFYYEVYEPAVDAQGAPSLKTSLAFYRGRVKVFETPVVSQTTMASGSRRTAVFQFDVPASGLPPGLYTCQVNIIDEHAGRFVFPRLAIYVR
jgi:VWFA-related protein